MQDVLCIWETNKETTKNVWFHVRTLCPAYGDIMVLGTTQELCGFHHKGVPIQQGFVKTSQNYLVKGVNPSTVCEEDVPFLTFVKKIVQRFLPIVVSTIVTSFLSDFALVREGSFVGNLPDSLRATYLFYENFSCAVFSDSSLYALSRSNNALSFRLLGKNVHCICTFDAFSIVVGQTDGQVHILHISWEERRVLCKIALPKHWDPVTCVMVHPDKITLSFPFLIPGTGRIIPPWLKWLEDHLFGTSRERQVSRDMWTELYLKTANFFCNAKNM